LIWSSLSIGFLAGLGPFRPLGVTPSTEPLALLPLALVPTLAVPLAIALHIVSLRRLHAAARTKGAELDTSSEQQMIRTAVQEEAPEMQTIRHG
jgi:hypothetical protein